MPSRRWALERGCRGRCARVLVGAVVAESVREEKRIEKRANVEAGWPVEEVGDGVEPLRRVLSRAEE